MRVLLSILCIATYAVATQVRPCENTSAKSAEKLNDRVQIEGCQKPPCRLKKNTIVNITLTFTPDEDVSDLKTTVSANILGISLPFIGVDGEEACNDLYKQDGTKVGCHLKAGETYQFRSKIDVLLIYPTVKTVVHWGLTAQNGKDVICFEVPARITP